MGRINFKEKNIKKDYLMYNKGINKLIKRF